MFDAAPELEAMPAFVTAEVVAGLIGLPSGSSFLAKRDQLERRHAFPVPMPGSKRPLRWRTSQVLAWVERNGLSQPSSNLPDGSNVVRLQQKARTA
ncbi:hypothetical protein [Pseudooceanicola sp.]|uniref:hypothetical protein n=1 Tax=Pseudooceanicola sp. TaxID=1914328 RepID=UPI0040586D65